MNGGGAAWRIAGAAAVLLTAGCADWPEPGRGGMAEHHAEEFALNNANRMNADFARRQARIDALRGEAERRAPARLAELILLANRIRREAVADMIEDARLDLNRLDHDVDVVERLLGSTTLHAEAN